jgi:hypothetical protein
MVQQGSVEHAGLLRAWHLAILRFAVTRENADRLGVLAIANEMDRLGRQDKTTDGFSFFRKTSASLCSAMHRQEKDDDILLRAYLAQIDGISLQRALAAALGIQLRKPDLMKKRMRTSQGLWKGLPSRTNSQT